MTSFPNFTLACAVAACKFFQKLDWAGPKSGQSETPFKQVFIGLLGYCPSLLGRFLPKLGSKAFLFVVGLAALSRFTHRTQLTD